MRSRWVCSRCCRRLSLDGMGLRFRFADEDCPLCDDPGCGMQLTNDKEHT